MSSRHRFQPNGVAVLDTYKTKEAVRIQDTLGLHSALIVAGNEVVVAHALLSEPAVI